MAISCGKPEVELPIEEEKLKEILIDIHVAEAAMQPMVGLKKDSLRELYFEQIFHIHEIHRVDFEATMAILEKEPKRMKSIYKELTEEVKQKKLDFRKSREMDKKKTNSSATPRPDSLSRSSHYK